MGWLIFIIIIATIVMLVVAAIVTDRIILSIRLNRIEVGMTGQGIMKVTKLPLKIILVNKKDGSFQAIMTSPLKIFKYKLYFKDGRYTRKERVAK